MAAKEFTEDETAEIKRMALELRDKMEQYFPKKCTDEEIAEIRTLREKLENMGFVVEWKGAFDPVTLNFKVNITLWLPKYLH